MSVPECSQSIGKYVPFESSQLSRNYHAPGYRFVEEYAWELCAHTAYLTDQARKKSHGGNPYKFR